MLRTWYFLEMEGEHKITQQQQQQQQLLPMYLLFFFFFFVMDFHSKSQTGFLIER